MEIISYKVSKLAAEKGYNIPTKCFYDTSKKLHSSHKNEIENIFSCYAPSRFELYDWLKNEKGINIVIDIIYEPNPAQNDYTIITGIKNGISFPIKTKYYSTHEKVLEAGLKAILKIL